MCLGTSLCCAIHTVQNPLICLDIAIVLKTSSWTWILSVLSAVQPDKQEDLCPSFVVQPVRNALR